MKALLALSFLAAAAQAGQVCHSTAYPAAPTNWAQTFTLPKHDPALGALQSVTVTARCTLTGSMALENPSPVAATYSARLAFFGSIHRPDATVALALEPDVESTLSLGAFDGVIDFGGSSGVLLPNLAATRESHAVLASPADLAWFTAASSGETITLGVSTQGTSVASGPGPVVVIFNTVAAVEVSVCYGYREVCRTASIPSTFADWQQTVVFAKHDPTLGALQGVRLRARTSASPGASFERLDFGAGGARITTRLAMRTTVLRPDASPALATEVTKSYEDLLTAYDGVLDFAGSSGTTHAPLLVPAAGQVTLNSPSDLALFSAGAPGQTIALRVLAASTSTVSGGGSIVGSVTSSMGVDIDVCYDYAAPPLQFCFGDGSGTACPCGNASAPGAAEGCLNSLGLGGRLRASGAPVIGLDTLVLTASNLPATAPVLFFQGTSAISSAFGDGLRCAGGTNRRLGTRTASSGTATFPPAGTTVSGAGLAVPGATLHYQAWYRNTAPFCTPSGFNLTNGLSIAW
ncbi:MAG: choice-of-anchor E domain-containing protein [Planctomycetota bacterium]|nr:choice-of-anchor E domain-containing protein [Planctomycetota bacterium]